MNVRMRRKSCRPSYQVVSYHVKEGRDDTHEIAKCDTCKAPVLDFETVSKSIVRLLNVHMQYIEL